jgi:hypothetical protein
LNDWDGVRAERLDELLEAHTRMGGTGPGRRYRTEQLNLALIVRLAGEFQGYARDLHDQAVEQVYIYLTASNPVLADVVQEHMSDGRALDRRNATPSTLTQDFSRFGLDILPALRSHDVRNARRQRHLERLNQARNAIAHANTAGFQQLASQGVRLDLATFRKWRAAADQIATSMDVVGAQHLATIPNAPVPW